MKKKVDERIRTLIENGVKARHRSMFVIVGDKSLDQVRNTQTYKWAYAFRSVLARVRVDFYLPFHS